MPHISETSIGGINLGQFTVMVIGGFVGVVIMRYAANIFIKVLETKPGLEIAAFLIVGWVGIKLFVIAAAHEKLGLIPHEFPHSTLWTVIFWVVLLGLLVWGVLVSKDLKINSILEEMVCIYRLFFVFVCFLFSYTQIDIYAIIFNYILKYKEDKNGI